MRSLLGGLAACALLTPLCLRLAGPRLTLENYRGRSVKVVGGLAIAGSLGASEAVALALGEPPNRTRIALLLLALGFFALGLLDDLAGDGAHRGLGGHLRALMKGRITTGAVKAFGGLALAGLVALWWKRSLPLAVLDGALVALAANFLNLLDLRPGRAGKAYLLLALPAVAASLGDPDAGPLLAATGATGVWVVADLAERGMLGDAGSNMLGALLGAGAAWLLPAPGRAAALVSLALLTLASERWSFSSIIDRQPALRWFDRLGRI